MVVDDLVEVGACEEAINWAEGTGISDAQKLWDSCERGDWMLWVIGKKIDCEPWTDGRKPLLLCALECAETVKHLWPEFAKGKIGNAIGVLRRWCGNEATVEEAKIARKELCGVAAAAAAVAVAVAADVAVAAVAADAAAADADAAARFRVLKECSGIVRRHYPSPPK